jgi:hypothetical protein
MSKVISAQEQKLWRIRGRGLETFRANLLKQLDLLLLAAIGAGNLRNPVAES